MTDRKALRHSMWLVCSRIKLTQDDSLTLEKLADVSKYILRAVIWVWELLIEAAESRFDPMSETRDGIEIMLTRTGGFLL